MTSWARCQLLSLSFFLRRPSFPFREETFLKRKRRWFRQKMMMTIMTLSDQQQNCYKKWWNKRVTLQYFWFVWVAFQRSVFFPVFIHHFLIIIILIAFRERLPWQGCCFKGTRQCIWEMIFFTPPSKWSSQHLWSYISQDFMQYLHSKT